MDAVKFLEKRARMYGHGCKNCRVYGDECDIDSSDCDYESLVKAVETLAKAVEMWAAKYPRKTRQDVFLEQWPDAELDDDGVLKISTCYVSRAHEKDGNRCDDPTRDCQDCRREFWMEEVE